MPSNLPLDDPCQGLPLSNRPMGYWQNMRNLNLRLPDCEEEEGLLLALFSFPSGLPTIAHFTEKDGLTLIESSGLPISAGANIRQAVGKAGDYHWIVAFDGTTRNDLYRSSDKGVTWELSFSNISWSQLNCGIPVYGGGVYWTIQDDLDSGNVILHKSIDNGESWSSVLTMDFGGSAVGVGIAVDPNDDNHVVAYLEKFSAPSDFIPHIWESTDGSSFVDFDVNGASHSFTFNGGQNIAIFDDGTIYFVYYLDVDEDLTGAYSQGGNSFSFVFIDADPGSVGPVNGAIQSVDERVVVTWNTPNQTHISSDRGITWDSPFPNIGTQSNAFILGDYVYALVGSVDATLYRALFTGDSWEDVSGIIGENLVPWSGISITAL